MDPFMVGAVANLAREEGWELPPRPPRNRRARAAIARGLRRLAAAIEPRSPCPLHTADPRGHTV